MTVGISVIIPARNEAALIAQTIEAVLVAISVIQEAQGTSAPHVEVIVVDNASSDQTLAVLQPYQRDGRIQIVICPALGSARARNAGAQQAVGNVLVFLDADTLMPPEALARIYQHCTSGTKLAGMTGLTSVEDSMRARLWWWFWCQIRRLPLARAKAMPALMFCTRTAFLTFGPFDEAVSIGEEWPILAGVYRRYPQRFIYDRSLVARSSSRRMELQRFGYARTCGRYIWAILHRSGRIGYSDRIRHAVDQKEQDHAGALDSTTLGDCIRSRPTAAPTGRNSDPSAIASNNR